MGTGGMRCGAGRPSYRAKAEQLQRVDIGVWRRGGYLTASRSFSWSWNRGGEPSGSINVLVRSHDSLTLHYMIGSEGKRRDGTQTIRLAHTACNYGNYRPWFVCPCCQRRAGLLFMRAGRFACRHCQRVAYTSQSEDRCARTWRAQQKLEGRLGENWQRPKGMRKATHEQLLDRIWAYEETRDIEIAALVLRLSP